MHKNRDRARILRKNLTEAEQALWRRLRQRQLGGHKFRRQQTIGSYIVDFVCLERKLIIEVDGGHHSEREICDLERTTWFESEGFRVLRFWNNQVLREIDAVVEVIFGILVGEAVTPHLNPPPQGWRKKSGGTDYYRNLVPSCIPCNRSKGGLTSRQFRSLFEDC